MNILFLSTHFQTGGITSYLCALAKGLGARGHRIAVATNGGNMVDALQGYGARHVTINIRTKSELSPKVLLSYVALQRFIRDNDIHLLHSQTRVTQVLGGLLARRMKRPHVTTCHGFFRPRVFRRVFPCWGDATIAISAQVRDHLQKDFHLAPERVFLIPHGMEMPGPAMSSAEKQAHRQKWGLRQGPVIGMVARLSPVKGQDILIRAMRQVVDRVPGASCVIVGEGKDKEKLLALAHQLRLTDNITFLPVVNQMQDILPWLDIFVMPSRQEGLGLSVLEAQANGLPVVASRVGGLPTVIAHGRTGLLVERENVAELAKAALDLIQDPEKARRLGAEAQRSVREHFSFDRMIRETEDVYKRSLA